MFVINDADGNPLFNGREFHTTDDAWKFVRETLCDDEWGDVYVQTNLADISLAFDTKMFFKTKVEYELIDHGVTSPDYFQGCGVAFTPYSRVVTGCGNNPAEAIEDALEQIATQGDEVDTDALEAQILADEGWKEFPESPCVEYDDDDEDDGGYGLYYYVSIRYNPLSST